MAVLQIVKMFQPHFDYVGSCLRMEASDVLKEELKQEWFHNFVYDMFHTLYSSVSGVGLSANQVGILKKVSVIDMKRDGKNPIVLVNPQYSPLGDNKVKGLESCMSFPNLSVPVERYSHIIVQYLDLNGNEQTLEADGFKAVVFQHEIDHLYGKVHIDLATDINDLSYYEGKPATLAKKSFEKLRGGG